MRGEGERDGERSKTPPDRRRPPVGPVLEDAALTGALGDYVREAADYTEADPAALLATALVCVGAAAGNGCYMMAGNRPQHANLFALIVAESPKANRGLSWAVTRNLLDAIDPGLARNRVLTGLGNGRSLLDALVSPPRRPDVGSPLTGRSKTPAPDHRLVVFEPGVTRALGVAARPSSPMTWVLRNAWDGQPIEIVGRQRRLVVEVHHVGLVAHATIEQLRARLSLTAATASLVNRFLFIVARRQRHIPDEGNVPDEVTRRHGNALARSLARVQGMGRIERTPEAYLLWRDAYEDLADDDPDGLLGIALARSTRHALRVSLVYAIADGSAVVDVPHVAAALALWRYARASASEVLDTPGDDIAGRLLQAVRAAGPTGLTFTEQAGLFGRNIAADRISRGRQQLEAAGLIVTAQERRAGSGRLPMVSRPVTAAGSDPPV